MTTLDQDSILQSIRELDPEVLLAKLANPDMRREFYQLDRDLGIDMIATRTAIESIPTSLWAGNPDLEAIVTGLVALKHPKVFAAIADKFVDFSIDQINQNPWIRKFINDSRLGEIYQSAPRIQAVNDRLTKVFRVNALQAFVGDDIVVDELTSPLDAIDSMMNSELLIAVLDSDRRYSLLQAGASGAEGANLVVHAITSLPVRGWDYREDFVADIKEILSSNIPQYAEAIVGIIEQLPDATIGRIGEQSPQGPHPLVELAYSREFQGIYGSDKLAPRITAAVDGARSRLNAARVISPNM